jgi:hypothetical protein
MLSRKTSRTQRLLSPSATVIVEIAEWARAKPSIVGNEGGRQSDFNDEQPESASASIRVSFDSDSKVNDERDLHEEKDLSPTNSTDAGRQIDFNDEQAWNANFSIRISFEPDSNINEQSVSQE